MIPNKLQKITFWKAIELGLLGGFIGSLAGNGIFFLFTAYELYLRVILSIIFIVTFFVILFLTRRNLTSAKEIKPGRPKLK